MRGFSESVTDPCVFIKSSTADQPSAQSPSKASHTINCFRKQSDTVIVLVYVDGCIVLSRSKTVLTQFIATLRFGSENINFTDEGSLSNYLGVEIEKLPSKRWFQNDTAIPDSTDP